MIYAVYLALILISVHALLAEDSVNDIRKNMDEKYDYFLTFPDDGPNTHYDVTRHDKGSSGKIELTYWTQDNKLDIKKVKNIKELTINVKSMFEDESQKVFKTTTVENPNIHMDYWFEAGDGIFTIEFNIDKSEPLESLKFSKFPTPKKVLVNNQEWWKTNTNYQVMGKEIVISDIPTGKTTVVLYFKIINELPTADFTMDPVTYAGVNEDIDFDASASMDSDGNIVSWVWSFGDQASDSGENVVHKYTKPGVYTIGLTVRDDAEPFGEDSIQKSITVRYGAEDDFDSDGLRDIWEWDNFNTTSEGPDDDWDGDGATNKEEHDEGTDPTDTESKPPEKDESKPSEDSGMLIIIVVVIVIVVVLVIVMFVLKSKKSSEEQARDEEEIAELEEKIKKAKSLGLPTRELEKLLKSAKEGKALEVAPIEGRKSKKPGGGRGSGKGRGRGSIDGKRRR
jgi:PKD repeat protein